MTNDVFTRWDGFPFSSDVMVTVMLRSGDTITAKACDLDWLQKEASGDIVAYKILEKITPELYGASEDQIGWEKVTVTHIDGNVYSVKKEPVSNEQKGHPNAAILMEIAKEAAVNPEYWKEFQWQRVDNTWVDVQSESHLVIFIGNENPVRRKPRTIRIGEYDVPEPIRFAQASCEYYMVNLPKGRFDKFLSFDSPADKINFNSGLCQQTKEGAELMLKALQELLGKK